MPSPSWLLAAVALAFTVSAQAQRQSAPAGTAARSAQRAPDSATRTRLERDIRRGFARAVRERVGLSDEQMRRLGPLTQRHEQQRRRLQIEERETRTSLRRIVRDDNRADSASVDLLLERLIDIQKRRVQLLEAEQRDLATIMTPIQRAQYLALQEQVRRRLEQMRQRRQQP